MGIFAVFAFYPGLRSGGVAAQEIYLIPPMETLEAAEVRADESLAGKKSLAGRIVSWDRALMRKLATLDLPKAVSAPLVFLVRVGDGWIWCFIALYLWWNVPHARFAPLVAHCLIAIAVSLAFYWPIKLLIRRPRPFVVDAGISAKVPPLDKYSFPSGHTMNNLAVALTLAVYLPHVFFVALLLPLLLGGLRVLFGVHFFSDIAGGAVLGAISYGLGRFIFSFLPF
jgi:undecaprenyl-diphosphatase